MINLHLSQTYVFKIVQLNVLKMVGFLNQFDNSIRFKLSRLNEKLNKLERALEFCEAAVKTSQEIPDP